MGVRSYVEPVRSRRCAQPPLPHHGYRIGVRYDECPLRLTGGNRYPWWGVGGGYVLTSSRSVVEGAPSHPYPTMGTASECGTTVWCVRAGIHGGLPIVLPAKAGIHGDGRRWARRRFAAPLSKKRPPPAPLGYRVPLVRRVRVRSPSQLYSEE